jgi:hypothetical protein
MNPPVCKKTLKTEGVLVGFNILPTLNPTAWAHIEINIIT